MADIRSMRPMRPFLKWAGGKSQLLGELDRRFPPELKAGRIRRYVEPFVGGGAVLFHVLERYLPPEVHVFDLNKELFLTYVVVQREIGALIEGLREIEVEYLSLPHGERERMYYRVREEFNREGRSFDFANQGEEWVRRAVQLLFLNRTCYNGLFRVNTRGEFNVPFGRYVHPRILDEDRLRRASRLLEGVHIHLGDFSACDPCVDEETFVYFDPPYRPLSRTSCFTSYAAGDFSEEDQRRLAGFFARLNARGARLMLSNSDPKNVDPPCNFFDELYAGFNIERVPARRAICCNGAGRGVLNELVITNYEWREEP